VHEPHALPSQIFKVDQHRDDLLARNTAEEMTTGTKLDWEIARGHFAMNLQG